MNKLSEEISPYLLQHKDNPVDWEPWGPEALDRAVRQDKPIILSIGYAACHWCHVMEKESFESQEVADIMNAHFVCIKVDREERPDVDMVYMEAIHQMGLSGGWPLNVFLMPDQKPFYGGTYFPKSKWISLLLSIKDAFLTHRNELQSSAQGFQETLQSMAQWQKYQGPALDERSFEAALARLESALDPMFGGLNKAPKFPMPSLGLCLESLPPALMTEHPLMHLNDVQLQAMAKGGIYDPLAGGFARYSVDAEWFCPHFEKMLYDNAQLLQWYALAYQRKPLPLYAEVVENTFGFLCHELKQAQGLYQSAIDADSEGKEGKFYTWTWDELQSLLPHEQHPDFYATFHIKPQGNWEEGQNILYRSHAAPNAPFQTEWNVLKKARDQRIRPMTDHKCLMAWNALLLSAFVAAAKSFPHGPYASAAQELHLAMRQHFMAKEAYIHQFPFVDRPIPAFLDDLAFYAQALLNLYDWALDARYLEEANEVLNTIKAGFKGSPAAAPFFYFASTQQSALIAPKLDLVDSVCPSANAVLAEVLLRISLHKDQSEDYLLGMEMLREMGPKAQENPAYFSHWLRLISEWEIHPKAVLKVQAGTKDQLLELQAMDWPIDVSQLWIISIPTTEQGPKFQLCLGNQCLLPSNDLALIKDQMAQFI